MPDRDTWCTPKWLADAVGPVFLDPCSNERSHIRAEHSNVWDGVAGSVTDGLGRAGLAGMCPIPVDAEPIFINPPYSRGQVIRWVERWRDYNAIFLVRWDPSTEWFRSLMERVSWVWFATASRINFEPPPGVVASSNPFPHALIGTWNLPAESPRRQALARLGSFFYPYQCRGA